MERKSMPKLRFPCKIKNGKITLLNRAEFDNAISNLEGNYYIELKETGVRSAQQNNYYWNIVRVIADELGYTFFNTDGAPDSTVRTSLSDRDFQEYVYTAGVTDDGIGEPLPEFSQFQIKIVMQGTDAANPPLIKDLRIIALS